jgi:glycosyltransferase involved in cell wall biosynthesis
LAYVRKSKETPFSIAVAKTLKKHVGKTVYEIPTFPYDKEMVADIKRRTLLKKTKPLLGYLSDKVCRNHLKRFITAFALNTDQRDCTIAFNTPAFVTDNGVDIDNTKKRNRKCEETVACIGVANVSYWHGYDRLLRGLYEYYQNSGERNILFHIVGEGSAVGELKQLTKILDLENHVTFHGLKTGNELDDLFDQSDIGVASLGVFRKGFILSGELKAREYCARAIPYITATMNTQIPNNFPWKQLFPPDESPISIVDVLDFYGYCVRNQSRVEEMRDFAKENLSWDRQLKELLKYLEG